MPYIRLDEREHLEWVVVPDRAHMLTLDLGHLNYVLTRTVLYWLGDNPNYSRYNAALGVLEAVKQELYRRQIAPYEDEKMHQNGDVY